MQSLTVAYLECPECGADAVPSSGYGCLRCEDSDCPGSGPERAPMPLWTEDDSRPCPECKTDLRIVVEDGRAWVREAAS